MHLRALSLINFRNYRNLSLACDEEANLFLGANGQGKTNLLEAVYYLCVARSCREANDKDLVILGGDFFQIRGVGVSSTGRDIELEIRYARHAGKKIIINEQPQKNVSDLYGSLAAVMMSPDDRQIIQGSPQVRRRFLDIAIAQTSPAYLATLQDYRRVVRQRNETLRAAHHGGSLQPETLEIWNEQLVQFGSRIMKKRQEVIARINQEARTLHRVISDSQEELGVRYAPSFAYAGQENIGDAFLEALKQSAREERARGVTVVGPHRDDLDLSINGVPLSIYGSQGQHKTAATALKLAEARFLWQQLEAFPLLLLDDIFAELDATRTARLIELLPAFGQVFITAAKESDISAYRNHFQRFRVQEGTVVTLA